MKVPIREPLVSRWVITRTEEREIYHARGGSTPTRTGTRLGARLETKKKKKKKKGRRGERDFRRKPKPGVSPPRPAANDRDTIFKFNLSSVRQISYLRFKLLDTPCTWRVFYLDSTTNQMLPLTDALGDLLEGDVEGNEANIDEEYGGPVSPSKKRGKNVEPPEDEDDDDTEKTWVTIESVLADNISTKLIEIHVKRRLIYKETEYEVVKEKRPKHSGRPRRFLKDTSDRSTTSKYYLYQIVPYRIGLKEFEVKLIVRRTDVSIVYDPHNVYDESISIDFNNPNRAIDLSIDTAWVSSPQAAAKSIVPFYMDLRSGTDDPLTFDTMDLTPLYTGPLFNIYYSNDDTVNKFVTANSFYDVIEDLGVANDISWEKAKVSEFSTQIQPASGLVLLDSDSYVTIDNSKVRWNLKNAFSFGLEWSPIFYESPDIPPDDRHLFTIVGPNGNISLKYNTFSQKFVVVNTDSEDVETTLVESNATELTADSYSIVVSYSEDTWSIRAIATGSDNLGTTVKDTSSGKTEFWPTHLIIGNNFAQNASATGYLRNIWARLSSVEDSTIDAYVADPNKFTIRNDGSVISGNYMAVLLAPLKYSSKIALGPNFDLYEKKQWTPISDDYKLGATTTYDLPRITAKYIALEFTNLVPQFYRASANQLFELRDFPSEVKNYYRSLPNSYGSFPREFMLNLFEGVRTNVVYNQAVDNDIPSLRDTLTYGDGGPVFIFTKDQSTIDYIKDPTQYDRNTTLEELKFATKMMKFFNRTWHNYNLEFVAPEIDRAYFVGIKDLKFYRSAQNIAFDTPEYFETFIDDVNLESNTNVDFVKTSGDMGYIESNFTSPETSATIVSKTFESISDFFSAQMAVIDGPWKSTISDDNIDLVDLSSIQSVQSTFAAESLSTYQGAKMGNVIKITPTGARYGIKSAALDYLPREKQRISGAIRILTDKEGRGEGKFVLNLKGTIDETLTTLMSTKIDLLNSWQEVDITYIAQGTESDIYLEIIQTDDRYKVSFLIDMIGVWYNPVIWEVSNDDGDNYIVPAITLGDVDGFVKFKNPGNKLKVRITITESGVALSTWSVIPDYQLTYLLKGDRMNSQPWTSSDNPKLRSLIKNPMYRLKSQPWPNKFSISR